MKVVTIVTLLYHSVYRALDSNESYDIRADVFEDHIRILRDRRAECIATEDLVNPEASREGSGHKVILTFDDGRRDNHEIVFPVLSRENLRAIFFVNPVRVGSTGFMDWQQLAELDRYGMSIQSHGLTHGYLHLLPPAQLEVELKDSKAMIEDRIGRRVEFLSVPGGVYSRAVVESAWSQGYRGIFTSDPGVDRFDPPVRSALFHRYNITRNTSPSEVADLLMQRVGIRFRIRAMHIVKGGVRKALGTAAYHRVWESLRKYAR